MSMWKFIRDPFLSNLMCNEIYSEILTEYTKKFVFGQGVQEQYSSPGIYSFQAIRNYVEQLPEFDDFNAVFRQNLVLKNNFIQANAIDQLSILRR